MNERAGLTKEHKRALTWMTRSSLLSRLQAMELAASTLLRLPNSATNERALESLRKESAFITRLLRWHELSRLVTPKPLNHDSSTLNAAPQFGERLLLLILTKEERVNIPGDLEEEYRGIATKHGVRYARLWYYKQVVASAWPLIRKALRWGAVVWIGEWIRKYI